MRDTHTTSDPKEEPDKENVPQSIRSLPPIIKRYRPLMPSMDPPIRLFKKSTASRSVQDPRVTTLPLPNFSIRKPILQHPVIRNTSQLSNMLSSEGFNKDQADILALANQWPKAMIELECDPAVRYYGTFFNRNGTRDGIFRLCDKQSTSACITGKHIFSYSMMELTQVMHNLGLSPARGTRKRQLMRTIMLHLHFKGWIATTGDSPPLALDKEFLSAFAQETHSV